MSFVEMKGSRPFKKLEEADIYSEEENKFLGLISLQFYRIEEMLRFNDKYQPIGKGTNKVMEMISNSDKGKKVFEFLQGALTLGVIGYSAINNIGITETLGDLLSFIPIVGENLGNLITNQNSNSIVTQLLADGAFASSISKVFHEISSRKDMIKSFIVDKLPDKIKKMYYEIENEKAEKIMQLEESYETDREAYESNKDLYKRKTKEILKEIFSRKKGIEKTKGSEQEIEEGSNEEVVKGERENPWQLSQEQINEQRINNETRQRRENTKTNGNDTIQQEDKDV